MAPKSTTDVQTHKLLVEACEDGWWYSAPLSDSRIVAAYMTDADIVSSRPEQPLAFWRRRLDISRHTKARLSAYEITCDVWLRPAWSQTLSAVAGVGWLAVGDAAFDNYLRSRATHYRMEARWPHSIFWRRRHTGDDEH